MTRDFGPPPPYEERGRDRGPQAGVLPARASVEAGDVFEVAVYHFRCPLFGPST